MSFAGITNLIQEFRKATKFIGQNQIDYLMNLVDEDKKKIFFSFLNEENVAQDIVSVFKDDASSYIILQVFPFVAEKLNQEEISLYLNKVENIFNKEEHHFKDKVHFFLPLLNHPDLRTEHLNKMVQYLIATPSDIKDKTLSSGESIKKYAHLFFNHPLFNCSNNAKNIAGFYYEMVNNLFDSKRKYQFHYIDSHNRAMPIKNNNYELFFKNYPNPTKHVIEHMEMDKLLFNSFLSSNIEHIEKSYFNQCNSLTYLVKKSEDKFPFNQFIGYYLNHSLALINEKDLHNKTPIQYAKKGLFNYHKKPSYKTLVDFGATPINNYFMNYIEEFKQLFKKEVKDDILSYQDDTKKDELEILKKTVNKNILDSIQKIYTLAIPNNEAIIQSIENIGTKSLEILDKHQNNFNDSYLFVKEVVLNYLPNFTNEFIHIYKNNPKSDFLDEYCLQIELLQEKIIEKQNLLDNITDEIQLQSMKKNTQFLKAKQ
jgi:hypothetical protein